MLSHFKDMVPRRSMILSIRRARGRRLCWRNVTGCDDAGGDRGGQGRWAGAAEPVCTSGEIRTYNELSAAAFPEIHRFCDRTVPPCSSAISRRF